MSTKVRRLTDDGSSAFLEFVHRSRNGISEALPVHLLTDAGTSELLEFEANCDNRAFRNRYEFGVFLNEVLSGGASTNIAYDVGLWNWLSLFYFNHFVTQDEAGRTQIANEDEVYVLPGLYDHKKFHRHLVRTPWLAVSIHAERARVLLIPVSARKTAGRIGLHVRGELVEQLASRQGLFGNPNVVEAAYKLYFDPTEGTPKAGAGGQKAGAPRRFAAVLQQLDLTFDLSVCPPTAIVGMLPKEFHRWR